MKQGISFERYKNGADLVSKHHFFLSENVAEKTTTTYTAPQKHESTLLYTYVLNFFESRPFMYNNNFLKTLLLKFVVHILTLLLAPFASKLVNYSNHSDPLNFEECLNIAKSFFSMKMSPISTSCEYSKTHCLK